MFEQIGATGRNVTGNVGQKWPNFENFVWTKMGGFRENLGSNIYRDYPGSSSNLIQYPGFAAPLL